MPGNTGHLCHKAHSWHEGQGPQTASHRLVLGLGDSEGGWGGECFLVSRVRVIFPWWRTLGSSVQVFGMETVFNSRVFKELDIKNAFGQEVVNLTGSHAGCCLQTNLVVCISKWLGKTNNILMTSRVQCGLAAVLACPLPQ